METAVNGLVLGLIGLLVIVLSAVGAWIAARAGVAKDFAALDVARKKREEELQSEREKQELAQQTEREADKRAFREMLQQQLDERSKERERFQIKLDDVNKSLQLERERNDKLEHSMTRLTDAYAISQKQIGKLENQVKTNGLEIDLRDKAITEIRQQLTTLAAENEQLRGEVQAKDAVIINQNQTIVVRDETIARLEREHQELSQRVETLKKRVDELEKPRLALDSNTPSAISLPPSDAGSAGGGL